jgi:hypothetical protein
MPTRRPAPRAAACLALLTVLTFLPRAAARADQLQCNSQADASRATGLLPAGSIAVAWCSNCGDVARVVRVGAARVVKGCEFEVELTGMQVARSSGKVEARVAPGTPFKAEGAPFRERIDLAYVYVETAPNRFEWLGGQLGLKAEVAAASLELPQATFAQLGAHRLAGAPQEARQDGRQSGRDDGPPRKGPPPPPPAAALGLLGLGFSGFGAAPLADAIAAAEGGDLLQAQGLADRALDALLAQGLASAGLRGLPATGALRGAIERGLADRLEVPDAPLRNLSIGRSLAVLEQLPTQKLEQVVATLAVWAGVTARRGNAGEALERAASALLADPTTLADLYRRSPRAAALAQFYAALYRGLSRREGLTRDELIVARRLRQYFADEEGAFRGNYAAALDRLFEPRERRAEPQQRPAPTWDRAAQRAAQQWELPGRSADRPKEPPKDSQDKPALRDRSR